MVVSKCPATSLTHGWHIPCNYAAIVPRYRVTGNYPAIEIYPASVAAEFLNIVIYPIAHSSDRFLTPPMNAVIKNRARAVAGISIIDQLSFVARGE